MTIRAETRRYAVAPAVMNLGYFLFAITLALILSFGPARAQEEEKPPYVIAVAGPMSGERAPLGRAMVDAVQLRVDEVNATGGIDGRQVIVKLFDDENSPVKAAEVAAEIAADREVLLVIGHRTSGASIAAAPIYAEAEIPAITGTATATALTRNNNWYFRVVYDNSMQADFIANYINGILGYKTATLISSDSTYGASLREAFEAAVAELPLEIAHDYEVQADSPDIDLDMADIVAELSLMPDSGMVFLAMNAENAAHFIREMRNSGFALPVFGADSINQGFPDYFEPDPILKTRPGDFTDQVYATTSLIWDVANEKAVNFRDAFRDRYGRSPDSASALYYDAASLALRSIELAEVDGKGRSTARLAVRAAIRSVNTREEAFDGITGKVYFDESGDAVKTVPVGVFELAEFISAPVQLNPVDNPVMVPNFSDKLEDRDIIPYGESYMHATQVVYFGIDLNEISNLNTATGNYTLDFYIWLRYSGELDLNKIEFANAVGPVVLENPIWERERNGMNIVTYKVRGTFHGDFIFTDYPFDQQKIVLEIRHRDRNSESLRFVTDRLGMRLTGEDVTLLKRVEEDGAFRTTQGWQITQASIYQDLIKTASTLGETRFFQGETEVNFSRIKMELGISRHLSSYATTILLPMTILFFIGALLFAVPVQELPPRLSGGILVLVTVSLLRSRLSNDLPNIGYLVAIDFVFFALQIIMWFGIAVSVVCYWLHDRGSETGAARLNLAGAILYPLPILAVGYFIWSTTTQPPLFD